MVASTYGERPMVVIRPIHRYARTHLTERVRREEEKTDPKQPHTLGSDPGETTDLAQRHPERLVDLVKYWHEYEAETGTILRPLNEDGKGEGFGRFTGVDWADWGQ